MDLVQAKKLLAMPFQKAIFFLKLNVRQTPGAVEYRDGITEEG